MKVNLTTDELQIILDLINLELSSLHRMDRANCELPIDKQIKNLDALKTKITGAK